MEQAAKRNLKVLIAGGCHVFGYPVGKQYGFAAVAERRLAAQAVLQVDHVRVSLKRSGVIVDSLQGRSADLVVLQIGNFECPVGVQRHFHQLLGRKVENASPALNSKDIDVTYRLTRKRFVQAAGRRLYDVAARALRRPLFDAEGFRAGYGAMLDAIAATGVPNVIAMSPLPCIDTMHKRYRLQGAGLIREAAESRGMIYLDTVQALGGPGDSQAWKLHCHELHLSREGQRLLGEALAALVEKHLLAGDGAGEIPR